MGKIKPIFTFEGLKNLLKSMGYQVDKAMGYRPVENKEIDLNDMQHNIEFTDEGIFLLDAASGSKQQIFLYKWNYHLQKYGKPRYHIRKCSTILDFIASGNFDEYRRANTEGVLVCDMDDGYKNKRVKDLPLCLNCLALAPDFHQRMTSSDFVEILKEAQSQIESDDEVDIFGYTKNWELISKAYRELHNYTCERCGLHIDNPFDQFYIHVHHKNGNKTDNRTDNFECLCFRCHASVDSIHQMRLTTGANKVIYDEFCKKYPK